MSTVGYIVRDMTGSKQNGNFAEGTPSTIQTSQSKDISLNLSPSEVESYARRGQDLHIALADGETLVLDGYFNTGSTGEKNLFLSQEGQFIEVVLEDRAEGMLYATYEPLDLTGKWSAYDEMVFLDVDRIEPVIAPLVAGPLLGGFGAAGAAVAGAAVLGTTLLGGDDGTAIVPTVNDPTANYPIGGTGPATVDISGTGAAGSVVVVTIGDQQQTVTVQEDGTWVATFAGDQLPSDGVYDSTVQITDPNDVVFDLDGPTVDIDTTPPVANITAGTEATGDIVNGDEHSNGPVISGTGEAGATVTLVIEGTSHSTTVTEDGSWSLTFAADEIPAGEYSTAISITTTDARGNSSSTTDVLVIDTIAPPAAVNTVEGDDIINATEASDGVTLAGTGEAGASLVIEFQGSTQTTTVAADGTWSVNYEASVITAGTYESTVSVLSTDAAGNSSTTTHNVQIDTEINVSLDASGGADQIIDGAEQAAGVSLTGTAEAGASVAVTFQGITRTVIADESGQWSASYSAGEIASGEYDAPISVTATDAAGNSETTTGTVRVDTSTTVSIDADQVGGDDIVNQAEAQAAITLTGMTEPGAEVTVTMAGVSRAATVDASGNWTAVFEPGTLTAGEYDTAVTVSATDALGNTAAASSTLRVDTVAGTVALSTTPIEIDDVINAVERADGVEISGTATPGLTVTVGLGAASLDVVADALGDWQVTVPAADIPTGTSTLPITASIIDAAGNTASVSDSVDLDTQVDNLTLSSDPIEGDNVVNEVERGDGVSLSGTVEPGSTVSVQLGAATQVAVVDDAGNWTATFAASDIPTGTYEADIIVSATDAAGNTDQISDRVQIDTEVTPLTSAPNQTTDDVLNTVERAAGVTLSGTVEPGSTVSVALQGTVHSATVDAAGNWSAAFAAGELAEGDYTANAVITATDQAGNVQTLSESFDIDTVIDTPVVETVTFTGPDVVRVGTQDSAVNYTVATLENDGSVSTPDSTLLIDTEFAFTSPVSDGTHLVISSQDAAGNSSSTLLVLEDNATNAGSVDHAGLSQFNIEALNLVYADETNLVLTEASIQAMSGGSDTLTIHGGADDSVTVSGANNTGTTRVIEGQTYDVYTIGDDGTTLVIEQDISVII